MADKKIRILIANIKASYMNQTQECFYSALERAFDVTYYGPGYQLLAEFDQNIVSFCQDHGPFDLIIVPYVFLFSAEEKVNILQGEKRKRKLAFDMDDFLNKCPNFGFGWERVKGVKVLYGFMDTYCISLKALEKFANFPGYVVEYGSQFLQPVECLTKGDEPNMGAEPNNLFIDYTKKNPSKFIPIMHVIADDYFTKNTNKRRKYLVSVPGASYYYRKKAIQLLKESNYSPRERTRIFGFLLKTLSLFKISRNNTQIGQSIARADLKAILSCSIAIVTDGMRLRYAVRKMFEAPARGAVMITDGSYGMDKLGYQANKHYIYSDGCDVVEKVEWVKNHPKEVQMISDAAYAVSKGKHSVSAWVEKLEMIIPTLVAGTYNGAEWVDGDIELIDP